MTSRQHTPLFRCFLAVILLSGLSFNALADKPVTTGKSAASYLPADTQFDASIPTPEEALGYSVGKWHVRHDQLASYMRLLAERSDRVSIIETGKTHEERSLLLLQISAPERQSKLDNLRAQHIANIKQGTRPDANAPLFLYMGYSIHGNEPSGSNASMLVAYYLAAGQDARINALLKDTVILLDPSFNPDGLSRFAQWANMHKGKRLSLSPFHREHSENWPNGRTNHYWFDLNRDWLLLTHPESKARIKQYHAWRPHVLTDFHEMGTNSTYFFQPGVRSRKNPLTPDANVTLTEALAKFHAKALDKTGQPYFTEEGFDDFYYGKGSTYPDAHGGVGILFEQASSRGHAQTSINGNVVFEDAIQNQVTTSFSTFDGALANRQALLDYHSEFYKQTRALIKDDENAGVVLKKPRDSYRFAELLYKLTAHQIEYRVVSKDTVVKDITYAANDAVFVPYNQDQYRLIKSLFSTRTRFPNNTFYDVSNWNIAHAFNVRYAEVSSKQARQLRPVEGNWTPQPPPSVNNEMAQDTVALGFDWHDYRMPMFVQSLMDEGVTLRVSGKAFSAVTANEKHRFAPGAVLVPRAYNSLEQLHLAYEQAKEVGIETHQILSGLTPEGIDLGSRNIRPMQQPSVLIIGGLGTSQYEVGEIWHYLDTRVSVPVMIVDQSKMNQVDLSQVTHIIAASGRYSVDDGTVGQINRWVRMGGTLIGQKSALNWFSNNGWLNVSISNRKDIDDLFDISSLNYADRDQLAAKKLIAGSTYGTNVDTTHPLFFGTEDSFMPMFKTSNMIIEDTGSPFETIAIYQSAPLLGGYTADELVESVANTAAVVVQKKGQGQVIGFTDNINFRGYWYGTSKLLGNALYLSPLIQ